MFVTGDLPEYLFSESVGGNVLPRRKDKTKNPCGRPGNDQEQKMQESFESRNKALEFTLFCKTSANMSKTLRELRAERRKLFNGFVKHCDGNKKWVKSRLEAVHKKRKGVSVGEDHEISGSDDSLGEEDSQESTLIEICHIEGDIKTTQADLEAVQIKKEAACIAL